MNARSRLRLGTITIDGEIADWLDGPPKMKATSLEIVGLEAGGDLAPAALGIYFDAFESNPDELGYVAHFNSARSLKARFRWRATAAKFRRVARAGVVSATSGATNSSSLLLQDHLRRRSRYSPNLKCWRSQASSAKAGLNETLPVWNIGVKI